MVSPILNTTQQIAAAFGSSLFIGLMGSVLAKNLEKIGNPDLLQQQAATSDVNTAFTAALVMVGYWINSIIFYKTA